MEENIATQEVNTSNQNVDNLLQSVSDEYLAKKRKNRKIVYSIISGLILALAIVIITLSCITVNLKPSFTEGGAVFTITINGSNKMTFEDSDEQYQEFNKLYTEAFTSTYLTALFSGKLEKYTINETSDNFYSDTLNNTGMSSTLSSALGSNYVRIKFDEEKQILNADNSVYYSKINSNYDLKFDELYFNLNTTNDDGNLTFYFGVRSVYTKTRITSITVKANTYELYNYVSQL